MSRNYKFQLSEDEWRNKLSADEFNILRRQGTELPNSGCLLRNFQTGKYACKACETEIFDSSQKFEANSGWPSFFSPISEDLLEYSLDTTLTERHRTEVICATCGSHLGHVFEDQEDQKKRFCINSLALSFINCPIIMLLAANIISN